MPANIQRESNNIYVLRLSGTVLRSEFADVQERTAGDIDAGVKPRILALLENFEGFERGADWGELELLFSQSHEIAKIAIVGDPRWERDVLAFSGAGIRKAPVRFFPVSQLADARAWVA
jgi:SpoIIAA-like